MEFTARTLSVFADFDIHWGDTVRIRDLYTPYYKLTVDLIEPYHSQYPQLQNILLYSFTEYPANVYDQFDEQGCLRNLKFHDLHTGSHLAVNGSVYPILAAQDSERFGNYRYVITDLAVHGRKYDINGDLQGSISEWLIEEKELQDLKPLRTTSQIVVAWECCSIIDFSDPNNQ